jgi:hypothetical protein
VETGRRLERLIPVVSPGSLDRRVLKGTFSACDARKVPFTAPASGSARPDARRGGPECRYRIDAELRYLIHGSILRREIFDLIAVAIVTGYFFTVIYALFG